MGLFSFPKEERLSKKKNIQELFDKGSSFYSFPFRVFVFFNPTDASIHNQVLITVSSKYFKRAVDRNRIKRRMRESYRLQKNMLPITSGFLLGFVYAGKEMLSFEKIKGHMQGAIKKLGKTMKAAQASDDQSQNIH